MVPLTRTVRALACALLLASAGAPADEAPRPDGERRTGSDPAGPTSATGTAQSEAGCDVCALRHRSKLRNRERLRERREASGDPAPAAAAPARTEAEDR